MKHKGGFTQRHFYGGTIGSSVMSSKKSGAGFTLIELLVVIAIIGFLASIAMVNLNTARNKAKVASVKGSITSLQAGMILCQDGNGNVQFDTAKPCNTSTANLPVNGASICNIAGIGTWPNIAGQGGSYKTTCLADTNAGTFNFGAVVSTCNIDCSHSSCTFTGAAC